MGHFKMENDKTHTFRKIHINYTNGALNVDNFDAQHIVQAKNQSKS